MQKFLKEFANSLDIIQKVSILLVMGTENKTKERPILFNGEMVRAILDGRKTVTRRVVKVQPNADGISPLWHDQIKIAVPEGTTYNKSIWVDDSEDEWTCPFGVPGDRLWVRETWADVNSEMGPTIIYRSDGAMQGWEDFCEEFGPDYGVGPSMNYEKYPGDYSMWWSDLLNKDEHKEDGYAWKPSIHMPRWASRITLEVVSVGVERIQEAGDEKLYRETLGDEAWDQNKWVWRVEFKIINQT